MRTFVIIKPDAIARGLVGEIISRFERIGFIERIENKFQNSNWCRQHYAHIFNNTILNPKIYSNIRDFMVGSSLFGIILGGEGVIERVRRIIGPTNCLDAFPGTIRGDFGEESGCRNLVHASDCKTAVDREIKLFFGD